MPKKLDVAMLADSGMPRRNWKQTFDAFKRTPDNAQAFDLVDGWSSGSDWFGGLPEKGVLLYGPTGVGKTHLACAAVLRLMSSGVFARFLSTARIPRADTDALLELADPDSVPVLLLDDLGAEKLTERALECLYLIIDGRMVDEAPMIVTTNYTPGDLREWLGEYGDRLLGRLRESCEFVAVGGDDWREKL